MKIVVLDGFSLNPGDLTWEKLESLGECRIYDRTDPKQVVQRAAEAEIVLTNKCPLTRESMVHLPRLRYIGVLATGYNIVDITAAHERGILVTNVPTYGTGSVAQLVFAHILHFMHHVGEHALSVSSGEWTESVDWSYRKYPLHELTGKTIGIVGYGRIGRAVARISEAFGMSILLNDPSDIQDLSETRRQVGLEQLLSESDIISLHCPLNSQTEKLINSERIQRLKSSAILINTSRGPLIDEEALAEALQSGRIAGAGLDVLSTEPPKPGNPLLTARNCYITPHLAWATLEARGRMMETIVENVNMFLNGNPKNIIPKTETE